MILDAKPFENFSLIFMMLLARFSRYTSLDFTNGLVEEMYHLLRLGTQLMEPILTNKALTES